MASVDEVIVGDWWSRYLGGQAEDAYAQLTTRCQQVTPEGDFVAAADAAAKKYGEQTISSFSVHVDGRATLFSYTFGGAPDLDQTEQRWIDDPAATLHIGADITTLRNDDC